MRVRKSLPFRILVCCGGSVSIHFKNILESTSSHATGLKKEVCKHDSKLGLCTCPLNEISASLITNPARKLSRVEHIQCSTKEYLGCDQRKKTAKTFCSFLTWSWGSHELVVLAKVFVIRLCPCTLMSWL